MRRLAIIATHPIQYYAPLFRLLAEREALKLRVYYGWEGASRGEAYDPGFGRAVRWDIPLLEGYDFTFVPNKSRSPGTHHFFGIQNSGLASEVMKWAPEAVLVYGWNYASHVGLLRKLHGSVPIIFRGDSTVLDEMSPARGWMRRQALSYMYRHIDIALFVGKSNCEYFETYGVTPDRLLWAPHSVENERFSDPTGRLEREAARWRARLGIRADVPVALFGGKLEKKKSPDLLLRSFLAHARPEAQLIFVGTGELEGELRRTAGSDSRIHFLGFQNQSVMPVVYRLADVYVLPSGGPGETWGLAVNEAMASERPVIVSDRVGCAADLVIDGETGFTFPHGDEIALGEALQRILLDTTRSRSLGAAASRLIERWSLLEQAARIEKAVEIALAPRRIPSR